MEFLGHVHQLQSGLLSYAYKRPAGHAAAGIHLLWRLYGWETLNFVTTLGAFLFAIGVLLFLVNIWRSLREGEKAGANPWDAPTLEWAVTSPPPPYNFAVIPEVASRHPLWESYLDDEGSGGSILNHGPLLDQGRETLGATALDGEPEVILKMPDDSFAPLVLALLLTGLCYCALKHSWGLDAVSLFARGAAC